MRKTIKKPVIGTILDVSTGHITKSDYGLLDDAFVTKEGTFTVYKYEEGYFIHISPDTNKNTYQQAEKEGYSEDFINLTRIAFNLKCWFLRLDCDGIVYPELPFHEDLS